MTGADDTTAESFEPSSSVVRAFALPLALAVTGLAMLVAGVVLFVVPKSAADPVEPKAAVAVTAQVEKFSSAYNTYDTTGNVKPYLDTLSPLVTDNFIDKLEEDATKAFKELAPSRQKSARAQVKGLAIETLDGDTARVLVAIDRVVSSRDLDEPTQISPRGIVSLKKINNEWLVSASEPVQAGAVTDPGGPITKSSQNFTTSGEDGRSGQGQE